MARTAAAQATEILKTAVAHRGSAQVVFAAPSQNELLATLREKEVPWRAITALQLDEYLDLLESAPQYSHYYLNKHLFCHLTFCQVHFMPPPRHSLDPEDTSCHYEWLISEKALDLACIAIGKVSHIPFNVPPVADFNSHRRVKVVELDEMCRQQQVHEGAFVRLDEVPSLVITSTISDVKLYTNTLRFSKHRLPSVGTAHSPAYRDVP